MPKRFSRVDLHKFLNQDTDASDVLRNHAFSRVGRGGNVGGLSVDRRRELALRRQTIPEYRHSAIGALRDRIAIPNRPIEAPAMPDDAGLQDDVLKGNRPQGGIHDKGTPNAKTLERRHHFIEPPRRNFNKYS